MANLTSLNQIWGGVKSIHGNVVAGGGRTVMKRQKAPDYVSILEKVGEEEDDSFVNMGWFDTG